MRHKGAPRVFGKSKQKKGTFFTKWVEAWVCHTGPSRNCNQKRGCVCLYQKGLRHEGKKRGCLVRRAKQRGFHNRGGRGAGAAKGP